MARPLRLEFPGALYHLTARGNARQTIFLDKDDYSRFVALLGEEVTARSWRCHAYCLMPNHYHLLMETPDANLVRGMHRLNCRYTQWFNRRHERVGHLFQGRYKSIIVESQNYLLELARYIVLNPVRAGIVPCPGDWPWSSYRVTAGELKALDWMKPTWLLEQFSGEPDGSRRAYRKFVAQDAGLASPWERLKGQIWLGEAVFLSEMESLIRGRKFPEVPQGQIRPDARGLQPVLTFIGRQFGISPDSVLLGAHQQAFQAAVYLLRQEVLLRPKDISALCGISPSRVCHIRRELERSGKGKRLIRLLRGRNIET